MVLKRYSFYEDDSILCGILDELVKNRELSHFIHRQNINGLGRQIKARKRDLKRRMKSMDNLENRYQKLRDREEEKTEQNYEQYKAYRVRLKETVGLAYSHKEGLSWIEKKAKELAIPEETLLTEFEERYEKEAKK